MYIASVVLPAILLHKLSPSLGNSKAHFSSAVASSLGMALQELLPLRELETAQWGKNRLMCIWTRECLLLWDYKIILLSTKCWLEKEKAMTICLDGMQNNSSSLCSSALSPSSQWWTRSHLSEGWHLPASLAARETNPVIPKGWARGQMNFKSLTYHFTHLGCRLRERNQLSGQLKAMWSWPAFLLQEHQVNAKICF